jgi:hypothetical protein
MIAITDPKAIALMEDLARVTDSPESRFPREELDANDQMTYVMIDHMMPLHEPFRIMLGIFVQVFSGAATSKKLLTLFAVLFEKVCQVVESHPDFTTREKARQYVENHESLRGRVE